MPTHVPQSNALQQSMLQQSVLWQSTQQHCALRRCGAVRCGAARCLLPRAMIAAPGRICVAGWGKAAAIRDCIQHPDVLIWCQRLE